MQEQDLTRWIGREQRRVDWITPSRVATWNATLNHGTELPADNDIVPPAFHWTLFHPLAMTADLSADGHPRRGGFLPPVPLPRRMWAGSRVAFHRSLIVGDRVEQLSVIGDVREKHSKRGTLVFVTVHHAIRGKDGLLIEEEQDIVYREPSAPAGDDVPIEPAPAGLLFSEMVEPTEALLFRYSALTFNGHRIHYDRRYAREVEGYPGLVVHGPLIATLLLDVIRRKMPPATVHRFHFKAVRPTFDISPFSLRGSPADEPRHLRLWSTNNRDEVAVEAEAWMQ